MNYNLRLGNYLKAKNNTKNIIILNTLAILPLLIYFMINYKFNILIFIILYTSTALSNLSFNIKLILSSSTLAPNTTIASIFLIFSSLNVLLSNLF